MKIVFPELSHPNIQQALALYETKRPSQPNLPPLSAFPAPNLSSACALVKAHEADALIAGIEYSSRDVILACRDAFGMQALPAEFAPLFSDVPVFPKTYSTFSGLAVMQSPALSPDKSPSDPKTYLLADMAACKHPTSTQFLEIILQTIQSAQTILTETPHIALLSFSTQGSGGHDETITSIQNIVQLFHTEAQNIHSEFYLDGEMQLDAAINPLIGAKKFPDSPVAGQANVLIAPDLNSGNLLYKAFEQIGQYTVAGPILQGFAYPVSDLSRGSTPQDILLTIETMARLTASKN